ncbi:MAG: hypothetical protein RLZZ546_3244 [Bacteroidota bacterium]|jgi:hypothetical protein
MKIKILYLIYAIFYLAMSSCAHKKMQFTYLKDYSFDSKSESVLSTHVYLVKGYKNNKRCEAEIDSFVCNIKEAISDSLGIVTIDIYKETDKTNPEYLRLHPNYFYSGNFIENDPGPVKDLLWWYEFKAKKFKQKSTITKYRQYKFHYRKPDCLVQ